MSADVDVAGEYANCPRCGLPHLIVWMAPYGVDRVCGHCGLGWDEGDEP